MRHPGLVLAVCIALALPACSLKHGAAPPAPPEEAAEGQAVLSNLNYVDEGDRTRVIIESNLPFHYSTYSARGDLFVVEAADVDTGALPEEIAVGSTALTSVRVVRVPVEEGRSLSRVEFHLAGPRAVNAYLQGSNLCLEIASPGPAEETHVAVVPAGEEGTGAEGPAEPAAGIEFGSLDDPGTAEALSAEAGEPLPPAAELPAEPLPAARTVNRVRTSVEGPALTVSVVGDGRLECTSFELPSPPRLVLDFPGTVNLARPLTQELQSGQVQRVRVAQFRVEPFPVTRVVLDLQPGASGYHIREEGASLLVLFGRTAEELAALAEPPPAPREEPPAAGEAPVAAETATALAPTGEEVETVTQAAESEPLASPAEAPAASWTAQSGEPLAPPPAPLPLESWTPPAAPPARAEAVAPPPAYRLAEAAFPADDDLDPLPDPGEEQAEEEETPENPFVARTIAEEVVVYTGEKIEFEFQDADLQSVFFLLADISGQNIVLDPSVKGKISIKLKDVPWDQALDIILRTHNLGKVRENNVIRIAPTAKLAQEEKERRTLRDEKLLNVPLVTQTRALSYAKAAELSPIVLKMMSARDEVIVDERSNTLIMKMIPESVESVGRLIDLLDQPTPQVMIEARIVETTKTFAREFGIQWGFRGLADATTGTTTNLNFPNNILVNGAGVANTTQPGLVGPLGGYAVNLPPTTFTSGLGISLGNILDTFRLDMALTAMENEGKGKILSLPKVVAQNNEPANIESGTQIPVQTTANNTTTTQFVTAALKLQVTPQITADETIIMEVVVDKSSPDFGNLVGGIPPILTRKAETKVMVQDGGTAVIGGIFQLTESTNEERVPFFSRIPIIKHLFRNRAVNRKNDELLLFLTPRIIQAPH